MNYKIITFVLLVVYSSSFFAQQKSETPVALIKKIVKDVSYKQLKKDDWEVAKSGTPLKNGEQVKTGFKSLALVLFTDGTGLLRVRENSTMYIYGERNGKKLNKNTFIEKGVIGFDVNRQDAEEFKFTTPTAVAAIRGTAGYLEVGSDSSTTVACDHGKIEVHSLVGEKERFFVEGGFALSIGADGKVSKGVMSSEEKGKFDKTKKIKTRKIFIEIAEGTIELEFYPKEK